MKKLMRRLTLTFILGCALAASAPSQSPVQRPALNAEHYLAEGHAAAQEKRFDQAVDAYRQAIRLSPNLADAHHGLGRAYMSMGRMSDAFEPLRTAARIEPDNSLIRLNLGITLAHLRRGNEALAELNEAKRLSPNDARVSNELGNVLHNSFGRIEDALAAYEDARRLDPNVAAIHHNIGLMLMRLGRFSEAVAPLREALRLNPQYRNARYFLSDAYSKTGRYEEAIESWGKFLEIVPDGPDALTNRAWDNLYAGGRGREAAADARRYLSAHGWRTRTSIFLAIIGHLGYREAGMSEEARAILDEAGEKGDTGGWPFPVVRYLRGELGGEELLALASDNDKKTEAHAYIGMDLLLKGEREAARGHFEWVRDYGNKRFFEYPLALAELKRLGGAN